MFAAPALVPPFVFVGAEWLSAVDDRSPGSEPTWSVDVRFVPDETRIAEPPVARSGTCRDVGRSSRVR